jgi:hypothetical protein
VTFDVHDDMSPAWSADGNTILFTSDRSGERDIFEKDVSGANGERPVFSSPDSKSLNAWSPDARFFIYDTGARASIDSRGHLNKDLLMGSLEGTRRVRPLAATAAAESAADISPDGTLVAYQSSEAGRAEVFVETFPEKGHGGRQRSPAPSSRCGVGMAANCSSCLPIPSSAPWTSTDPMDRSASAHRASYSRWRTLRTRFAITLRFLTASASSGCRNHRTCPSSE